MNLSELDYELPPESIAQWPLAERDASRMMLLERSSGAYEDHQFRELPNLLRGDELVVMNNARVLPARLFGHRSGVHAQPVGRNNRARSEFLQTKIEVLLIRQLTGDTWEALVRPGRKIPTGESILFGEGELEARVEGRGQFGLRTLHFRWRGDFREILDRLGHIPLPPYIKRADEPLDRERYQTVYAREGAAVAAPTAGLHFTSEIIDRLRERGIEMAEISLDVGLGTFEPIRTESLEEYKIHREGYAISEQAADTIESRSTPIRGLVSGGTR